MWKSPFELLQCRRVHFAVAVVTLSVTAALAPVSTASAQPAGSVRADVKIERHGGADRYETSLLIAEAFAKGADGALEDVVMVSGRHWTDAVVAASVASVFEAPILMTPPGELRDDALAFLKRVGAENVHVVAAGTWPDTNVSPQVFAQLREAGFMVDELFGADRYSLGAEIARWLEHQQPGGLSRVGRSAILANGEVFADALVAGPLSYKAQVPLLLTPRDELHSAVADYLRDADIAHVVLMGGTAALSEDVATAIRELGITEVDRMAGSTRFETATMTARYAADRFADGCFGGSGVGLARARVPFDALGAAPLLAQLCAPLVLTDPANVPESTAGFLDRKAYRGIDLTVFGGATAVSQQALDGYLDTVGETGRSIRPMTGVWTVAVVICAPEGRYTTADLQRQVARLNDNLSPRWEWESSGRFSINFVEGGLISPDGLWPDELSNRTTDKGLPSWRRYTSECRSHAGELPPLVLSYGPHAGLNAAVSGGWATAGVPSQELSTELHELAHSVLRLGHTRVCRALVRGVDIHQTLLCGHGSHVGAVPNQGGSVTVVHEWGTAQHDLIGDQNVEGARPEEGLGSLLDLDFVGDSLACYERELLGWPVGGNSPPCVRLPPEAPRDVAVEGNGGKLTVSWTPPDWTDGAPVTGYAVSVTCSDSSYDGHLETSERMVPADARSVTFDVERDGLLDDLDYQSALDVPPPGYVTDCYLTAYVNAFSEYGKGATGRVHFGRRHGDDLEFR